MILEFKEFDRFGDIILKNSIEDLYQKGFAIGDLVLISINDNNYLMPFTNSIANVLPGDTVLCIENNHLSICILNGDFVTQNNISSFTYDANNEIHWKDVKLEIHISMVQKGGYLEGLKLLDLKRSNKREDYQSDEAYGNFRMVMFETLYRSSSPINPYLHRNQVVDKLLEKNHINAILNLSDTNNKIINMINKDSYYYKLFNEHKVITINVNADLNSQIFKERLVKGLNELVKMEGPYLIHCLDGKDRTGFVIFLLMAIKGFSKEEIEDEYLKTYISYYHLDKDDKRYKYLKDNALKYFYKCIGARTDIQNQAIKYLKKGKMNKAELNLLKQKLNR